ncbi:LexA family protein [Atrimonas thermophila]|uniref:LexA family protein n=1 Tax=Atrimonas thermophila TaxID=3064161 RepID=UPI00399D20C8
MSTSNTFGQFLKKKLQEKGYTLREFGERLGVSHAAVSHWIRGKNKPPREMIPLLAKELGVNIVKLYSLLGYVVESNPNTIKVKVLSAEIPCGTPREYIDTYIEDEIEIAADVITTNPNLQYYAVRAKGNSMILRGIADGYLVIFSPDLEVRHGDIGIVWINHGVCARTVLYRGDHIILQPANPAYEPIVLDRKKDEYRIIGRVVAVKGDPNRISAGDIFAPKEGD